MGSTGTETQLPEMMSSGVGAMEMLTSAPHPLACSHPCAESHWQSPGLWTQGWTRRHQRTQRGLQKGVSPTHFVHQSEKLTSSLTAFSYVAFPPSIFPLFPCREEVLPTISGMGSGDRQVTGVSGQRGDSSVDASLVAPLRILAPTALWVIQPAKS